MTVSCGTFQEMMPEPERPTFHTGNKAASAMPEGGHTAVAYPGGMASGNLRSRE